MILSETAVSHEPVFGGEALAMKTILHALLSFVLAIGPALAEPSSSPAATEQARDAEPEIVVTGFSKPFKLTGKQLVRAQQAFDARRSEFAPGSQLYFKVSTQDGSGVDGVDLYLKSGDQILDLPLDSEARFTLPPLAGRDWALYANRAKKALEVTPLVLSPGTAEFHRRLGDLRLQCNVQWAMSAPEISIFVRSMFAASGGCKSGKFAYYVKTSRPITGGIVSNGEREISIKLWGNKSYETPIGEKSLSNASIVKLRQN